MTIFVVARNLLDHSFDWREKSAAWLEGFRQKTLVRSSKLGAGGSLPAATLTFDL